MAVWIPDPIRPNATLIDTGNRRVRDVKGNVLYAHLDATIYKSSDWGDTWTEGETLPATIRQLRKTNSDNILAFCADGKIYSSNAAETDFVAVLDTEGASFAGEFGVDIHDNLVLAPEYGNARRKVYLSTDYGLTWRTIFEHPLVVSHIHDATYDPYEGLIWVASGDGQSFNTIFVSPDLGETWDILPLCRCTNIIPLPECVLFGLDEVNQIGYLRYDRHLDGSNKSQYNLVPAFLPNKGTKYDNAYAWATKSAIIRGENTAAYFGFGEMAGNITLPEAVYATRDGYKFYQIWQANQLTAGTQGSLQGIYGIFGPSDDGHLAVVLRRNDMTTLLKLAVPSWVSV